MITVHLCKPSGKYYTTEKWRLPAVTTTGPRAMRLSPDYRTIAGGPVIVPTQKPWGYPEVILSD